MNEVVGLLVLLAVTLVVMVFYLFVSYRFMLLGGQSARHSNFVSNYLETVVKFRFDVLFKPSNIISVVPQIKGLVYTLRVVLILHVLFAIFIVYSIV